jgi:electron transport complex protein RnfC
MGLLSFKGGIHPPHHKKVTEHCSVKNALEPSMVFIPLRQHIGAPCDPVVKKGDVVKKGQVIGEASALMSAFVHSSVSGTVVDVKGVDTLGGSDLCVIIESDGLNEWHESVKPKGDPQKMSAEELLKCVKEAGIVGMGGAGFPTHIKLAPPKEKQIDSLVINGAECEPYLTADHRLMLETPEKVYDGIQIMMKILGVEKAYVGIEDNKPDAIDAMKKQAEKDSRIKIVALHTKYPQGAEKQLIYACTGKMVPSGGLPMDAQAVVNNVATAAAIADAVLQGIPLVERICTVTGSAIGQPQNLRIKVGTPIQEIVEQCGGVKGNLGKIIMGGPMMGLSTYTFNIPSTKTTSGILLMTEEEAAPREMSNCIKCNRCVEVCPAFLQPVYMSAYSLKDDYEGAERFKALDCIECGSCSFVCPANRPLLPSIRVAKREILAKRRKQG